MSLDKYYIWAFHTNNLKQHVSIEGPILISLMDNSGCILYTRYLEAVTYPAQELVIEPEGKLLPGIYFLQVSGPLESRTLKLCYM